MTKLPTNMKISHLSLKYFATILIPPSKHNKHQRSHNAGSNYNGFDISSINSQIPQAENL